MQVSAWSSLDDTEMTVSPNFDVDAHEKGGMNSVDEDGRMPTTDLDSPRQPPEMSEMNKCFMPVEILGGAHTDVRRR